MKEDISSTMAHFDVFLGIRNKDIRGKDTDENIGLTKINQLTFDNVDTCGF